MKAKNALERAAENEAINKLSGYFLSSVFSIIHPDKPIEKWTLTYYNPERKECSDFSVTAGGVEQGESGPPMEGVVVNELDTKNIKTEAEEALEKAKKDFRKKMTNILFTLHNKEIGKGVKDKGSRGEGKGESGEEGGKEKESEKKSGQESVKKEEKTVWTITFICTDLTATVFDIDASNGEVLNREEHRLATTIGRGG